MACVKTLTFGEILRKEYMVFKVGPERVEYMKSPVRGCVLTGLEEVGMKERRETSFLCYIFIAIIVPYLNRSHEFSSVLFFIK